MLSNILQEFINYRGGTNSIKKYLLLIIAICIEIIIPCNVYAVDATLGANTWYMWSSQGGDVDPGFLIGPALSVKFNKDFNLTFVYLYGKFTAKDDDGENFKIKRYDSDLALNYRLNNYFKAFAGVKYIGYKSSSEGIESDSWGPGIGLSCTFPIIYNFFLLGTLSGFYLWSTDDYENDGKDKYKSYGFNSTLSIAYYVAHESIALSLGWRYQYFIYSNDADNQRFHGLTVAATYSFAIN